MTTRSRLVAAVIAGTVAAIPSGIGAAPGRSAARLASAPAWLRDAMTGADAALDKEADAVVLLDEVAEDVGSDGRLRTTTRYAVRVRTEAGIKAARITESYAAGSGRIKDIKAWVIKPAGQVVELGRDSAVDMAYGDDYYTEVRAQRISGGADVTPGAVFGAEVSTEDRTLFTQFLFPMQATLPVAVSRRIVKTPDKWTVKAVAFNHAAVEPAVQGRVSTWEVRNLPGIKSEPSMPALESIAPRLAIDAVPPPDAGLPALESWRSVSQWLATVQDPPAALTDALREKAAALTKNETTLLGKIKAVGRFAQDVRYVSIQMGLSRGGGYRPRPAADLLTKNYGDCKDKANLMRALLTALDIRAYLVGAFLGDPGFIQRDWPSPSQFNHAIVAISVDESITSPAVLQHPELGRLLIFDATNDQLPVGDLSDDLQGSFGLVVTPAGTDLVRLPVAPADRNLVERRWSGQLDAAGTLSGSLTEISHGDEGARLRWMASSLGATKFSESIERGISAYLRGAEIRQFNPKAAPDEFDLSLTFSAPKYAQALQPTMWLVAPPGVPDDGPDLASSARRSPILLAASMQRDVVELNLPAGFVLDEVPAAVSLDTSFGTFTSTTKVEGTKVVITRAAVVHSSVVPADRAPEVKQFFDKMRAAKTEPLVLAQKR